MCALMNIVRENHVEINCHYIPDRKRIVLLELIAAGYEIENIQSHL